MRPFLYFSLVSTLALSGCGAVITNFATDSQSSQSKQPSWIQCTSNSTAGSVGINVNNLSFQALESPNLIDALQQSGAGWVRINLYWAWRETSENQFDWSGIDDAISNLQAAHLNLIVTLDGPVPCWALANQSVSVCTQPQWTIPPTDLWLQFVNAAVSRYKDRIHYWEIWNEPDLPQSIDIVDPIQRLTSYRDSILTPTSEAIHDLDSSATVLGPTFAAIPEGNTAPGIELQSALALVLGGPTPPSVDIITLHSYFPYRAYAKSESAHIGLASAGIADRPVWITEEGANLEDLPSSIDPEQERASFLTQEMSQPQDGVAPQKIIWFAATDSQNGSGVHTNDYGLINNIDYVNYVWTPRATFTALQNLIGNACGVMTGNQFSTGGGERKRLP